MSPLHPFDEFPVELQYEILKKLDTKARNTARNTCHLWRDLTNELYFREESSSCLYLNDGYNTASPSEKGRLNIRIVLAAKTAWKTTATVRQHTQLRPLLAHEMGTPRPSHPVNISPQGNHFFLFSDEGSRKQTTPLKLQKEEPLTIEIAQEDLLIVQDDLPNETMKIFHPSPISLLPNGISSSVALSNHSLLRTTETGTLERTSSSQVKSSTRLAHQYTLLAASMEAGLIATAFTSGEITVFEEKEAALVKIYSTYALKDKQPVHTLLFNKTLELLITTTDGAIFSICPFPREKTTSSEKLLRGQIDLSSRPFVQVIKAWNHFRKFVCI